ncbi:conserved oligomeric Golgi complex subunit 4 [Colias croceus]|uniref:conserved oligomeric Golgi complex subunit 4 n=1 Tax=Colias crocea TaxID=72248 RepID=UPI001E27ADBA|nr:conserved oligomeric Golgi complex subunit 4 [Colias croceus]
MSIALLLEKYDVSTEEGLQKALNDIEKEESEVNEALSNALSKACVLEGRLRSASQAYTKLGEVKSDAQVAADMVNKTAALARDVSAKVRQLDLARSRVAECQQRVHDLIDLKVCSAGVDAAIKAHDYETAAGHISRFLSMEPASVAAARARGDTDPRHDITAAANTLREHLIKKFEEASKKEDDAAVERLFKLFPQIGCAEQGVDLLSKYVASQLETTIRRACVVSSGGGAEAAHADALTRVLEAGAGAVERVRALAAPAPHTLPRALATLQPPISSGARTVCRSLVARRSDAATARDAEPALHELALAHSRLHLYFVFLRRRLELNTNMDEKTKSACAEEIEKIISESDMTRTAQDILGQYLSLERFYLEESVNKALKLSTPQPGMTTSSLVDDVFFIARKVIRRGVSTGSVEGVCCVVNEAGAQLARAAGALRRRLGAPPPDALPLPPPRAPPHPPAPPCRDADAQANLYFAHMTEAEQGAEWSERIATEACEWADALCRTDSERDKVRSCAAGFADAAAAFRSVSHMGLAALRAALQPAVAAWADYVVAPDLDIEEVEEQAGAVASALDTLASGARARLGAQADALLADLLGDLIARAHKKILTNTYDQEGGICVERRARRLAAWAGAEAGAAREKAARLTHAAALLALDAPQHAAALPHSARPPTALAADLLARRLDFKLEDIKRIKW